MNKPVIEASQADRDAAADVWRDYVARIGEVMAENAIRQGASDETLIVQAFARHRIAHTPDPAGLREALEGTVLREAATAIAKIMDGDEGFGDEDLARAALGGTFAILRKCAADFKAIWDAAGLNDTDTCYRLAHEARSRVEAALSSACADLSENDRG